MPGQSSARPGGYVDQSTNLHHGGWFHPGYFNSRSWHQSATEPRGKGDLVSVSLSPPASVVVTPTKTHRSPIPIGPGVKVSHPGHSRGRKPGAVLLHPFLRPCRMWLVEGDVYVVEFGRPRVPHFIYFTSRLPTEIYSCFTRGILVVSCS